MLCPAPAAAHSVEWATRIHHPPYSGENMRYAVQIISRRPFIPKLAAALAVTLAVLITGTPAGAQTKEASRVRILVTADTDAQGAMIFGLGIDGDNVKRVFDEQFTRSGKTNRYTLELYKGNEVSPLNILNYY